MIRTAFLPAVCLAAALLGGCPDNKGGESAATGTPESTAGSAAPTAAAASAEPSTTAAATALTPTASAAVEPSGSASGAAATGSARAAPPGSAAAGEKTFDCGAKGQKPCPMQGWMKSVMGSAAQSGDGEKLASALATVASKPVPGFGQWTTIANEGVAKAKANDIEGAKKTCEKCHALYKDKYKKTMRDRPW